MAARAVRRRDFLAGALGGLTAGYVQYAVTEAAQVGANEALAMIERATGGQLHVAALGRGQRQLNHRADQKVAMCSTFKWLLAAQVLSRVDAAQERLERVVPYGPVDLLDYSPVTTAHVGEGGLTVQALCAAAVQRSDNTAANVLLQASGGPAAFTRYVRSLGDAVTRLDRVEPALNSALPGDPRDTTTANAMVGDLASVLAGERALSVQSRQLLFDWLVGSTTGTTRLRAGLPSGWRIGDKTGTGSNGCAGDVAIVWPPNQTPMFVAAYVTGATASSTEVDAAFARVGAIVAEAFLPV